jgi:small neutral amino acid transporter SnatA (MarC family)
LTLPLTTGPGTIAVMIGISRSAERVCLDIMLKQKVRSAMTIHST